MIITKIIIKLNSIKIVIMKRKGYSCQIVLPLCMKRMVSKLYESTIFYKCEDFLNTCDNQFGFKRKHSTEFCI